jgi:hypothetical protein
VGKKRQRGRISYAQLGINQLGAVYEGLLSFTGFFGKRPVKLSITHNLGRAEAQFDIGQAG